jgi:phage shock protein B
MGLSELVVFAPFAMVVAIIWLIQKGKNHRAELQSGNAHRDDAIVASMQQQIDKLTARVQVLERLVTDDDRRLSREIDGLRNRERPPA